MGWKVTREGLVIDGPFVRPLAVLVATPVTVLGVVVVSGMFTASRRLPDPPRFIKDTEVVSEFAAAASPLFSGPVATVGDIGFFVFGLMCLFGGGLLLVKGLTESDLTVTFGTT